MSSDPVTTVPKYAYFEVVADGKSLGRVEFELSSKTPLTSKNFGKLCTGFTFREKQIEYKNTYFHRVIPGFMCQFGDVTEAKVEGGKVIPGRPGTGGVSCYGAKFADENFVNPHHVGALSMANAGPGTNGSQIFVCTSPCDFLDGKHVVFGKIKDDASMKVVKAIESYGSKSGATSATVYVSEAGVTEYYKLSEFPQVAKSCYFDIVANGSSLGRAEFALSPKTPLTSNNFANLCKGFPSKGKQMEYKNTYFHRVIPGFMCQFGDVTEAKVNEEGKIIPGRPGTGGVSSYGAKFADENFVNPHHIGALSMANAGPGTNGSQIFVCTSPCDFLDGKHVVFGKIKDDASMAVIKKVESFGSKSGATSATVYVSEAGVTEYFEPKEVYAELLK